MEGAGRAVDTHCGVGSQPESVSGDFVRTDNAVADYLEGVRNRGRPLAATGTLFVQPNKVRDPLPGGDLNPQDDAMPHEVTLALTRQSLPQIRRESRPGRRILRAREVTPARYSRT